MNRTKKLSITRQTVRSLGELTAVVGGLRPITGDNGNCDSHMATCGRATVCLTRRLECPSRVEC